MNCIVDGYSVTYQRVGKGPAVLLLHGWGDTNETFKPLTMSLKKHYECITLDLPGFGGSEAPREPFDLEVYATFVAEFLKKIDVSHVYAFIGHSNGGAIAIRGVSAGILRTEKLVLLASSGVRSTYNGRKKVLRYAAKAAKFSSKILPKRTQKKLKVRAYRAIGSDLFVAEHLQETFKRVVSEDIVHDAAMINAETLLIYGALDTATPPAHGERFNRQIEKSKLHVIEGAGHFVHQDAETAVGTLVTEFLDA